MRRRHLGHDALKRRKPEGMISSKAVVVEEIDRQNRELGRSERVRVSVKLNMKRKKAQRLCGK